MNDLSVRIDDKRFNAHGAVVSGLEFSAAAGEFIALLGPSGAGKSVLLSLLAGLDQTFTGRVTWHNAPLYAPGESPERLGILFQEPRLMPWLSVRDNVTLVLRNPDTARSHAQTLLADVGLGAWLDAFPGQLSGGMQRRAALARAFAVNPRLLLMDEPFVSVDQPTGARLRWKLLQLWERERPLVLFVTHDLREALAMADRVLFLSPSPAHVVLDYKVDLTRPRSLEDEAVTTLQTRLLKDYPELLSGLT